MLSFVRYNNKVGIPVALVEGGRKNGEILYLYNEDSDYLNRNIGSLNIIKIDDGKMFPIPKQPKTLDRNTGVITGPSGSGKSTWCAKYIELALEQKKRDFYLFSNVNVDESLDKLKPIRVPLDYENLVEEEVDSEELKGSICLFDDVDTGTKEKDVQEAVMTLRDKLLQTGRHEEVDVFSVVHVLLQGPKSKILLLEAQFYVFSLTIRIMYPS